jgi:hypothetical protein
MGINNEKKKIFFNIFLNRSFNYVPSYDLSAYQKKSVKSWDWLKITPLVSCLILIL